MPLIDTMFSRMVSSVVSVTRENCILPRMINKDYALELSAQGKTVDVPIASAVPARGITPGFVPPATSEAAPTTTPVTLDYWQEAPFVLREDDLSGLGDPNSYISRQLEECGRTIANAVDASIFNLYKQIPHTAGVAGTTPFGTSLQALQEAERVMITNKAPIGRRGLALDPFAWANALGLDALADASKAASTETLREGNITRVLGYDWGYDQNAPFHTAGTFPGTPVVQGAQPANTVTLAATGFTANTAGVLAEGDVITIGTDPNPYTVLGVVNSVAGGAAQISISPGIARQNGLVQAAANNAPITRIDSHRVSLAMHPDFAAFASRRTGDVQGLPTSGMSMTWGDPVSGLVLDARIVPYHYQTYFSISALWGVKIIRPEFAVRILG
jgi:hypothetical protein